MPGVAPRGDIITLPGWLSLYDITQQACGFAGGTTTAILYHSGCGELLSASIGVNVSLLSFSQLILSAWLRRMWPMRILETAPIGARSAVAISTTRV